MSNITNIPAPRVPLQDERTGLISREWYRYLFNQFITVMNTASAVGEKAVQIPGIDGEPGEDGQMGIPGPIGPVGPQGVMGFGIDGQDAEEVWMFIGGQKPPASAPFSISVGASPFVYTAIFDGEVVVSGGGVTALEFSRDSGATYFSMGALYAPSQVRAGDKIRVTYAAAPTMTFIPN